MKILVEYTQPRGDVKKVYLDDGTAWELKGECKRCGKCCESIIPPQHLDDGNGRCKMLSYETQNGVHMAKCGIMEQRPWFCFVYPRDPYDPLLEGCGYRWVKVEG